MRLLHTTANGKPLTFVAANILSLTRRTSGGTWLDFIDGTAISVDDSCESLIAQLDDSPVAPPTVTPPTGTPLSDESPEPLETPASPTTLLESSPSGSEAPREPTTGAPGVEESPEPGSQKKEESPPLKPFMENPLPIPPK